MSKNTVQAIIDYIESNIEEELTLGNNDYRSICRSFR